MTSASPVVIAALHIYAPRAATRLLAPVSIPRTNKMGNSGHRVGEVSEAQQALATVESVSDCVGPGLAIQRGAWGNQEAQVSFFAVYNIAASDGAAYTSALQQLAERQSNAVPGPIFLFENRAGTSGVSHIVVIGAPSMSTLNTYLDSLFASPDFERFSDAVGDIRTIVSSHQVARVMVLAPEGS